MAKRFTDTTKWNDDWFFNLNNEEKLAWIYILDSCDHAGIWKKNLRLLNFQIGSTFVEDDLKKVFATKFIEIGDKWFIPKFIKFQYGKTFLTSNTPAVKSARELLLDIGFIQQDDKGSLTLIEGLPNSTLTLTEGLDKGYDTLKDKDKDKDMVQDTYEDMDEVENIFKDEDNDKRKRLIKIMEQVIEDEIISQEQVLEWKISDTRDLLNEMFIDYPKWEEDLLRLGQDEFVRRASSKSQTEINYIVYATLKAHLLL